MIVVAMMLATPFAEICAQNNSNPWPAVGNVGIGAASNPGRLLNIHGVGSIGNVSDPTLRLSWHSSADDAFAPEFMAHLSLITSSYNRTMYSYCRDFFGSYQTTVKDLVLQTDIKAGDIIVANRCTTGYIRFATTPPPANPLSLQPGDLQDIERFTILPSGQVGVGTHSPYGKFDINFDSWNCEYPKISFSNNAPPGTTGYTANPSIRFYAATGTYQFGDPPVPLTCEQIPARAWWLEAWNGYPGSFHIRSGVSQLSSTVYESPAGLEVPISRMSFLGNGNVGVNNEGPTARFQVTDGSVLFDGTTGATPTSGAGTRLMWIPEKAAFRAGVIAATYPGGGGDGANDPEPSFDKTTGWNHGHIGYNSFAFGYNSRARNEHDIAIGMNNLSHSATHGAVTIGHANRAIGEDAVAIGYTNRADGYSAHAYGFKCRALAENSLAMGAHNEASNSNSAAIGNGNTVSGSHSFAIGGQNTVSGNFSGVIGRYNTASNDNATALGLYNWAETNGSLCIGYGVKVIDGGYFAGAIGTNIHNDLPLSLAIGYDTGGTPDKTIPTLFVGCSSADENFGRIGIGTNTPQGTFALNTTYKGAIIGSSWITQAVQAVPIVECDLAVQNRVGIGTASPQEALSVTMADVNNSNNPNTVVIWNTPQGIAENDVDLSVQEKVVIGGTGTVTPETPNNSTHPNYGYMNTNILLNVYGDAIKSQGGATWRVASDVRYKKDVEPFNDGLEKIRRIKPVTFRYNGKMGIGATNNIEIGIIAQNIQEILPYMVSEDTIVRTVLLKEEKRYETDAVDTIVMKVADPTQKDENGHYILKDSSIFRPAKKWLIEPAEFVCEKESLMTFNPNGLFYLLVNSIKELDNLQKHGDSLLNRHVNELKSQNDSLSLIVTNFHDKITRLEAEKQIPLDGEQDILLEQNNPNPFSDVTAITYYIPEKVAGSSPELLISSLSQNIVLQRISLIKGSPVQISISAKDFETGVYVYSIFTSGKIVASKKFIVIH